MTGKPTRIVVDTCVWLDNYLWFRPGCRDAQGLIDTALGADVCLLYAVTAIKDVYYLAQRLLKEQFRRDGAVLTEGDFGAIEEIAWSCVSNMEEIATAVGIDSFDIHLAAKYRSVHRDFEDNLAVAAVQRAQADLLVTNNRQLIGNAPVAALSAVEATRLIGAFV